MKTDVAERKSRYMKLNCSLKLFETVFFSEKVISPSCLRRRQQEFLQKKSLGIQTYFYKEVIEGATTIEVYHLTISRKHFKTRMLNDFSECFVK